MSLLAGFWLIGIIPHLMNVREHTKLVAKGLLITLLLVTFFIYYPSFAHGWVGDDYVQLGYVREVVKRPFSFLQIFHPTWTFWYYRPLQNVWFTFGELLFGKQPELFYAVQIGVHMLVTSLVYRIARQFALHPYVAVASAALFAIHGHHVDVVTWISAIAIVLAALFSLAAVSCFLDYLKRPLPKTLLLTTIACILALLSHEESIILPPFLLLMLTVTRWHSRPKKKSITILWNQFYKAEIGVFLFLFALIVAYVIMQLLRPNATIDLSSTQSGQWLSLLSPDIFQSFWQSTIYQFTFWGQSQTLMGFRAAVFVLGSLGLLGMAVWYGNHIVRLGLLWAGLHLAFIYVVLWTQKPEFYAGRHIYNALPGIVLVIGAGLQQIGGAISNQQSAISQKSFLRPTPYSLLPILIIPLLIYQVAVSRSIQAAWLTDVTEEQSIQAPMQEIMPTVTSQTHVFANRLPITPKFLRSMVYVWYGVMPPEPGGILDKLLADGEATDDFYVFDYENGRLFNLMPELQQHEKTILLLAQPITHEVRQADAVVPVSTEMGIVTVAGPEESRHLSLQMNPPSDNSVWATQSYFQNLPANSKLAFGTLSYSDLQYRVVLDDRDGMQHILWESSQSANNVWEDVEIDLTAWGETAVILYLEVKSTGDGDPPTGYWSNPRMVID